MTTLGCFAFAQAIKFRSNSSSADFDTAKIRYRESRKQAAEPHTAVTPGCNNGIKEKKGKICSRGGGREIQFFEPSWRRTVGTFLDSLWRPLPHIGKVSGVLKPVTFPFTFYSHFNSSWVCKSFPDLANAIAIHLILLFLLAHFITNCVS